MPSTYRSIAAMLFLGFPISVPVEKHFADSIVGSRRHLNSLIHILFGKMDFAVQFYHILIAILLYNLTESVFTSGWHGLFV